MAEIVRAGVRLHYEDVGDGSPVFFHTGGGGDGSMWRTAGYLDALPGRRHLLYDHRGHGRSDQPEALEAHRIEEYVADVVAVLDAAGIERAAFVGYSGGAQVLFRLAATYPERVTALVGIGGVAHPGDTNAGRRAMAAEARANGLHAVLDRMAAGESEPPPGWLMDNLETTPTEMFALHLEGWADTATECADFPRITAPTLILCGDQENTDGAVEAALAVLPRGQAVVVPGFGHLQAFWRTDVTAAVIADFLARYHPVAV